MKSSMKSLQMLLLSCGLLLLLLLVAGCRSTTLTSQRLDAKAEPDKQFGIVYQMTKPQFTISAIQPTDTTTAPKYTLNVEFVPDADRRFAVSSNPGKFSESDITVNLNSNGAMTGLTQTSREQVTPTIKAIGDFTTSIIGAAATYAGVRFYAADDETAVVDSMKKELNERLEAYMKKENLAEAKVTPNLDALVPDWPNVKEAEKVKLEQRLRQDAESIKKRLESISTKPNYKMSHLAEALKPEDRTTQVNILKVLAEPIKMTAEEKEKEYEVQLHLLQTTFPDTSQSAKPLDDAAILERELAWERKLVEGEVLFAKKNEDLLTLVGYSRRVVADAPQDSQGAKERKNLLKDQANDLAIKARNAVLSTTTFPNLLGPLIRDKTPAQQIYQQVKDIQEKIGQKKALLVKDADPAKRMAKQKEIDHLTRDFYQTIGAADEYAEILKLQKMIKDGPPKAISVAHSSPLQEYAAARSQLAALNEAVTLKLGKVAADAADAPPAKQPEWNPAPDDRAFCWNVRREKMEGKLDPPRRILVPEAAKAKVPALADRVATRVSMDYREDINSWPKYVVVITEVKP